MLPNTRKKLLEKNVKAEYKTNDIEKSHTTYDNYGSLPEAPLPVCVSPTASPVHHLVTRLIVTSFVLFQSQWKWTPTVPSKGVDITNGMNAECERMLLNLTHSSYQMCFLEWENICIKRVFHEK